MKDEERLRATERFLHERIPLTRAMQVGVESFDERQLTLIAPLAMNHNHLGTAFGGSLAALAMLAGYSLLWLELGERDAHVVVSESAFRFRRPVLGDLRATCRRPAAEALARFKRDFAAKGKARIQLAVEIAQDSEVAVVFSGTYVAKK